MSNLPENDLDLEKLFLPAWAQEGSSTAKYAKYDMPDDRQDRRWGSDRPNRPPRREFGGENRRGPGGPGRPEGGRPDRVATAAVVDAATTDRNRASLVNVVKLLLRCRIFRFPLSLTKRVLTRFRAKSA